MSQNRNDESTALMMVAAFIGMVMMVVGIFIALVVSFLCFVATILCLIAWNKPLVMGRFSVQPRQARWFVYRGLIGAVMLPLFTIFCIAVTGGGHELLQYILYIALGGYVAGSIGIEAMMQEDAQQAPTQYFPPPQQLPASPQRLLPAAEREPFRYASWDDEEENRG